MQLFDYDDRDKESIFEEYGDMLFAAVNAGRLLKLDPEGALTKATNKFIRRFDKMEQLAKENGKKLDEMTLEDMDKLWDIVKEKEGQKISNK